MHWADGFIAVDWGTTNRRAYLIGADGACTREFEDDKGILSVAANGFEAEVAAIRDRLGDGPMLLAGMVGSNRGWIEVPYAPCPAGPEELARRVVRSPDGSAVLIPGVSYSNGRADVMRGEEVQLLGAVATGEIAPDCLVCHPGTHNKWVLMRDSRIQSFRTVMTGELFNLLREKSILSDLLKAEAEPGAAFAAGVDRGLEGSSLAAELFEVRANVLLGRSEREDAAAFVSGLLIGQDVRVGIGQDNALPITVMGRPELTRLYTAALAQAGFVARECDGERAFIAGARKIVELLQ
ncbi:2-dehydro-3-deoxygalactonokinase [Sphingomonas sinipercae]|uniref:2-dehydro-3-deoxygalactonokinase n=1 Tax=Sphingomonas sinipercae TaxID=2714944 RepID=A0A6G7ZLQ0_9SPHN|nr:2-dehydro-3-deoxygalactonokinase [Sphingomonas sinipercae]QIL01848.1 2-dehydro-3-deoxygalactonokinase [Sphingomonas sinipercae]